MKHTHLFRGLLTFACLSLSFSPTMLPVLTCYASTDDNTSSEEANPSDATNNTTQNLLGEPIKYTFPTEEDANSYCLEVTLPSDEIRSTISLDIPEGYAGGQIHLVVEDKEYYLEEYTYYITNAYYIPGEITSYVVVSTSYDNDYIFSHLFSITDDEIEYANSVDMTLDEINVYEDSAFLNGSTRANIFGSYRRPISAELRDGHLNLIDAPYYELITDFTLTTAIPLEVTPVFPDENTPESITLEKGSDVLPTAINTENSEFIVTYNDELYAIPFEENYVTDEDGYTYLESRTVYGISEYDVFEMLPYAG